ncbi:MAG: MFS transporter [Candidatus Thermofonsia Clade 1 bacterium]|jgi:MFS family permease|uniref:MFS transporter n=1 Tax=Candidatus Thermofonsia Clade 1 bacterium TaxID=2364210 RepID=A0A2M8PYH9_9CHLR|nr:MAG: MFS transporter [Candidatus Thermofonsia Clade 1 bacterium]
MPISVTQTDEGTPEVASPTAQFSRTKTFSALSHAAFRWFFFGQLVSVTGTWMQSVALQIVVYAMTGSKTALGAAALAQGIPALVLTPFAGVIVERVPRRKLLILTQSSMMALAFLLAALYISNALQVWHILAISLGIGIATALDAPSRLAFLVEMVGKEDLPSGIMLNSMMFNTARIVGPALGGLALHNLGAAWCFLLNAMSFSAVLFGLFVMRVPPAPRRAGSRAIWKPLLEGLQFARRHPVIAPLLLLSALSSTFGLTFTVLLPPFADTVLGNTELGTSALLTAQGIGALCASIFVARSNARGSRGITLVRGAIIAPAALIALSLTNTLVASGIAVCVAGFGFVCQFVLTNTLIQAVVPDNFRGRVLSLYTLTFFGLSPIGSLIMGMTADQIGTLPAILIFGGTCLAGAILITRRAVQLRQVP